MVDVVIELKSNQVEDSHFQDNWWESGMLVVLLNDLLGQ